MEVAHIDAWRADPERFWHFYGNRFQTLEDKEPNGAHHALVELERRGKLDAVDHPEHRPPAPAGRVAGADRGPRLDRHLVVSDLRRRGTRSARSARGWRPRRSRSRDCDCGEPLKPDVVLFGEWLPEGALERAYALAAGADVLLCIGSSLEVHPIAQLPGVTRQTGGAVAVVTQGPTPWDARAAVKLDGDVVAELRGARRRAVAAPALQRSPQPCSLRRPSVGVERRPLMMMSRPEQEALVAGRRGTISGAIEAIVG